MYPTGWCGAMAVTTGFRAAFTAGNPVATSSIPMPMNSKTAGATSSTPRIAAETSVRTASAGEVNSAP